MRIRVNRKVPQKQAIYWICRSFKRFFGETLKVSYILVWSEGLLSLMILKTSRHTVWAGSSAWSDV